MLKVIVYTFVNNERNNLGHTDHIFCNFILSFNFQDKAMLPKCTLLGVFLLCLFICSCTLTPLFILYNSWTLFVIFIKGFFNDFFVVVL